MPAYANLGGSIDMPFSENHKLLAALDLGYTFMPSTDAAFAAGFGLEYNFLKYGIIRAGYHYGDEKAIGGSYANLRSRCEGRSGSRGRFLLAGRFRQAL